MNDIIGAHQIKFTLIPNHLNQNTFAVPNLQWTTVKHGTDARDQMPLSRGIYAFTLKLQSDVAPDNDYILYIGIAGAEGAGTRTLRDRYSDYLNQKKVLKRGSHIVRMLGTWHEVLNVQFAEVDNEVSAEGLKLLEKQLNDALLPPFSRGDITAELKSMRNAFP
jgi:hypothetical protein